MSQPIWQCVANLGDINPLDCGGFFVLVDQTGVYAPEVELLLDVPQDDGEREYMVYRFILEPCTYIDGILSDNPFHPGHPAWFATPESRRSERPQDTTYLQDVANTAGIDVEDLIKGFCSTDPIARAFAWREIGDYHGYENLDNYPLRLTRAQARARYDQPQYRLED